MYPGCRNESFFLPPQSSVFLPQAPEVPQVDATLAKVSASLPEVSVDPTLPDVSGSVPDVTADVSLPDVSGGVDVEGAVPSMDVSGKTTGRNDIRARGCGELLETWVLIFTSMNCCLMLLSTHP